MDCPQQRWKCTPIIVAVGCFFFSVHIAAGSLPKIPKIPWPKISWPMVQAIDSGVPVDPAAGFDGFSGTQNLYDPITHCPSNAFITGIQLFRNVGGMLNAYVLGIRYACRSKNDDSIVIRKTDPLIPDETNWSPFSASEPVDGPITKCDDGLFVTAIQGFKYGIQADLKTPLSGLGYECKGLNSAQTEVRRTDADITEQFHVPAGFSGTLRPNCPVGTFVVAIQGYRAPADSTTAGYESSQALSELRFLCERPEN
jgi:hypothetical protein